MEEQLTVVVITNSGNDLYAYIFDDFEKACHFIEEDFKEQKTACLEDGDVIDKDFSYCFTYINYNIYI